MTSRLILRLAPALLCSALVSPVAAAPKDAAATTKIDEAINVHYLATDFTKAEGQLLGVIKACGKDCSPNVIGRAWMYVGLVRGSGKQDLAGARDAFGKAKDADPATQIDTALATPEVQAEFDTVFSGATPAKGKPAAAAAPAGGDAGPAAAPGELDCNIDPGSEIEVRRPIPISCSVPEGAKKVVLAYKEFGGTQFVNVPMNIQEGNARAPIPCSATKMVGTLSYVIVVKDGANATIASVGTLEQPAQLNIVQSTIQAPPAFPGEAPPARCAEEVECPPGMPGCTPTGGGGWGDSCTPAEPCKKGLYCASGTCENAPSCEVDSDCESGRCSDGFCDMGDSSSTSGGSSAGYRKIWIGLHFGVDVQYFGGAENVCNQTVVAQNRQYACYENGAPFQKDFPLVNDTGPLTNGFPQTTAPGGQGTAKGGFKLATMRALLSFDYALTANLLIGGRLGYAFNGGPPNYTYTGFNAVNPKGKSFLAFHVEPRLTYHFVSLAKPGIHPYVHVGGGLAQVDGRMKVQICNNVYNGGQLDANATNACAGGARYVDVYKRLGQGFVELGGGVLYPFGKNFGAQANLNIMYMLPDAGLVLEPSIGAVIGF